MLNQCILVGKVDDVIKEEDSVIIRLNIENYANREKEADLIDIQLKSESLISAMEHIKKYATIGIKGRVITLEEKINNKLYRFAQIVAEKITFINEKKQ